MKKKIVIGMLVVLAVAVANAWAQQPPEINEQELVAFVKEVNPPLAERIEKVRSVNHEEYRRLLFDVAKHYNEVKRLQANNPDLAAKAVEVMRSEGRTTELAEMYKRSQDPQEKEKIRSEMKSLLFQAFDNKLALREAQAGFIENELQQLKARIAQKRQNKEKIIEKRFSDLTAENYLQWD